MNPKPALPTNFGKVTEFGRIHSSFPGNLVDTTEQGGPAS